MFTKVEKFVTYNHPDQRTCMIQLYFHYNPTSASNTSPTTLDNGTVGLSWHWEIKGKEDLIQCTRFSAQTVWNAQACSIGNTDGKGLRDYWDASTSSIQEMGPTVTTLSTGSDCDNGGTVTSCYTRYNFRVSGMFGRIYKPTATGDTYTQCVTSWQIGGNDRSKCIHSALNTKDLGCTNDGVMADASEVTLGFAVLFGALSFF